MFWRLSVEFTNENKALSFLCGIQKFVRECSETFCVDATQKTNSFSLYVYAFEFQILPFHCDEIYKSNDSPRWYQSGYFFFHYKNLDAIAALQRSSLFEIVSFFIITLYFFYFIFHPRFISSVKNLVYEENIHIFVREMPSRRNFFFATIKPLTRVARQREISNTFLILSKLNEKICRKKPYCWRKKYTIGKNII